MENQTASSKDLVLGHVESRNITDPVQNESIEYMKQILAGGNGEPKRTVISSSFDLVEQSFEQRPKRNCKSSTRQPKAVYLQTQSNGSNNSQKRRGVGFHAPSSAAVQKQMINYSQQIPLHDLSGRSGVSGNYVPGIFQGNQTTLGISNQKMLGQQFNVQQNNPYAYLKMQQQKYKNYKSHRSNIYKKQDSSQAADQEARIKQKMPTPTPQTRQETQVACKSSCSSGSGIPRKVRHNTSSSSNTGLGASNVKSLSDVKNPQFFINFRFSNKGVSEIPQISNFKNLTDLDISGNLLVNAVPELLNLNFLKKLNLAKNQIQTLWPLPLSLEILNLSQNCLSSLDQEITQQLKNLVTLDISHNQLESLDGIQDLKRLKRALFRCNQILSLHPLSHLTTLIEIDAESNKVNQGIFEALKPQNDILKVSLLNCPCMASVTSVDAFTKYLLKQEHDQEQVFEIQKKLKYYSKGVLYRSKRVSDRIHEIPPLTKRSSNFSNGSSSCGQPMSSPILSQKVAKSQRYEEIQQLYDQILDEEEGIQRRQAKRKRGKDNTPCTDEGSDYDFYDDDFIEATSEDDLSAKSVANKTHSNVSAIKTFENNSQTKPEFSMSQDQLQQVSELQMIDGEKLGDLDQIKHEYLQQHPESSHPLNESTADFNKEIRQINQELKDQDLLPQEPSIQSTQGSKKGHPMFKLDLSKCINNEADDEEENFDIPALNFVKVDDDSFRQGGLYHIKKSTMCQNSVQSQRQASTLRGSLLHSMRGVAGQQPDFKLVPAQYTSSNYDHTQLKDKIIDQHKQKETKPEQKQNPTSQQQQQQQIPKLKLADLVLKSGHIMPSERSGEKKPPLTANSSKKSNLTPKDNTCENCILQNQQLKEAMGKQKELQERVSELELKLQFSLQKEQNLSKMLRQLFSLPEEQDELNLEEQIAIKVKNQELQIQSQDQKIQQLQQELELQQMSFEDFYARMVQKQEQTLFQRPTVFQNRMRKFSKEDSDLFGQSPRKKSSQDELEMYRQRNCNTTVNQDTKRSTQREGQMAMQAWVNNSSTGFLYLNDQDQSQLNFENKATRTQKNTDQRQNVYHSLFQPAESSQMLQTASIQKSLEDDEACPMYPSRANAGVMQEQRNDQNFVSKLNFFGSGSYQSRPKSQNAYTRGRTGFSAYGDAAEKAVAKQRHMVQRGNATGSLERYTAFGNYTSFYNEEKNSEDHASYSKNQSGKTHKYSSRVEQRASSKKSQKLQEKLNQSLTNQSQMKEQLDAIQSNLLNMTQQHGKRSTRKAKQMVINDYNCNPQKSATKMFFSTSGVSNPQIPLNKTTSCVVEGKNSSCDNLNRTGYESHRPQQKKLLMKTIKINSILKPSSNAQNSCRPVLNAGPSSKGLGEEAHFNTLENVKDSADQLL